MRGSDDWLLGRERRGACLFSREWGGCHAILDLDGRFQLPPSQKGGNRWASNSLDSLVNLRHDRLAAAPGPSIRSTLPPFAPSSMIRHSIAWCTSTSLPYNTVLHLRFGGREGSGDGAQAFRENCRSNLNSVNFVHSPASPSPLLLRNREEVMASTTPGQKSKV